MAISNYTVSETTGVFYEDLRIGKVHAVVKQTSMDVALEGAMVNTGKENTFSKK